MNKLAVTLLALPVGGLAGGFASVFLLAKPGPRGHYDVYEPLGLFVMGFPVGLLMFGIFGFVFGFRMDRWSHSRMSWAGWKRVGIPTVIGIAVGLVAGRLTRENISEITFVGFACGWLGMLAGGAWNLVHDVSASSATGPTFHLRQLIAVATTIGCILGLCVVLLPAKGRSRLLPAALIDVTLVMSLWFSRTSIAGRLKAVFTLSSMLALALFVMYRVNCPFPGGMMGHTILPPLSWAVSSVFLGFVGLGTGVMLVRLQYAARYGTRVDASQETRSRFRFPVFVARWTVLLAVLALIVLMGILDVLASFHL